VNDDTNPAAMTPTAPIPRGQAITWASMVVVISVGLALLAVAWDGSATMTKIDAKALENEHRIERIELDSRADGETLSDIKASLAHLQAGQASIIRRLVRDGQ
jgi:hypothetical protein